METGAWIDWHKSDQSNFRIEPLDRKRHDRVAFSCGVDALDRYLKQQASQDIEKRVAAVLVLTSDRSTIAGYYTLSQYAISVGQLPEPVLKRLKPPRYPELPTTLLGRLARDVAFKGQKIGELLLMDALKRLARSQPGDRIGRRCGRRERSSRQPVLRVLRIRGVARTPKPAVSADGNHREDVRMIKTVSGPEFPFGRVRRQSAIRLRIRGNQDDQFLSSLRKLRCAREFGPFPRCERSARPHRT